MTVATRAAEIARRDGRGAEGGEWGRLWDGFLIPSRVRGLGSVVSSPSGVGGEAPVATHFMYILDHILTQNL